MNKRLRYLLLVLTLVAAIFAASGCGADSSALAGDVSGVSVTRQSVDAADAADVQNASAADSASDNKSGNQSDGQAGNSGGNKGDKTTGENGGKTDGTKYDASEFMAIVPEWTGEPFCVINENTPDFDKNEIWTKTQESLDPLDSLGRCGTANSCIGVDGMPTKPRGNISEIHPTGWHTDKYDFVEGGNLYNRCHLIAHKLSGDDAVARNLITGTSYMNRQGMLPFEDQIEEYVKSTGNHVMYRVTPCFVGDELVARGVHMQAVSVEDGGKGLAFNVFCYNVEPGIEIDYKTGDNKLADKTTGQPDDATQSGVPSGNPLQGGVQSENGLTNGAQAEDGQSESQSTDAATETYVLNTNTGKFHHDWCKSVDQMKDKNKQVVEATRDEVIAKGYDPCKNCNP